MTIAIRPSVERGMAQLKTSDLPDGASRIFFGKGLDHPKQPESTREISVQAHAFSGPLERTNSLIGQLELDRPLHLPVVHFCGKNF